MITQPKIMRKPLANKQRPDKNVLLTPPGHTFVGIMTRPEAKKLPDSEYHCHVPAYDKENKEMSPYHVAVYRKDEMILDQFEQFRKSNLV